MRRNEHPEASPGPRHALPARCGPWRVSWEAFADHRDEPPDSPEGPSVLSDEHPGPRSESPAHWEASPSHWDERPAHWDERPDHWDERPDHWEGSPNHWEASPNHWEAPPNHWDEPPGPRDKRPNDWDERANGGDEPPNGRDERPNVRTEPPVGRDERPGPREDRLNDREEAPGPREEPPNSRVGSTEPQERLAGAGKSLPPSTISSAPRTDGPARGPSITPWDRWRLAGPHSRDHGGWQWAPQPRTGNFLATSTLFGGTCRRGMGGGPHSRLSIAAHSASRSSVRPSQPRGCGDPGAQGKPWLKTTLRLLKRL